MIELLFHTSMKVALAALMSLSVQPVFAGRTAVEDGSGDQVPVNARQIQAYLTPQKRPKSVASEVDTSWGNFSHKTGSCWGKYNGKDDYMFLGVSQLKLAEQLIRDAYAEGRKDVYILDSGAGNFQSIEALSSHIDENLGSLSGRIRVHILGTRAEQLEEEEMEVEARGMCTLHKLGGFKIEDHQRALRARGFDLDDGFDLIFSHWTNRHLVDPLGTCVQLYNTTRPGTGLLVMDWGYFNYEGERVEDGYDALHSSRGKLVDLLFHTRDPFLLQLYGCTGSKDTDCFVLRRVNEGPLQLPLAYTGKVQSIIRNNLGTTYLDAMAGKLVEFRVLDETYRKSQIVLEDNSVRSLKCAYTNVALWGSLELYNWFLDHELVTPLYTSFDQLFQIDTEEETIEPLYTEEELEQRRVKKKFASALRMAHYRLEKAQKEAVKRNKKAVLRSLKLTRQKTRPACAGLTNGFREEEWFLYKALKKDDITEAGRLIDEVGADVNRVMNERGTTLLDMAMLRKLPQDSLLDLQPQGIVQFLLDNGASVENAHLDNALRHGLPEAEVLLLLDRGIPVRDLTLSLYRSVERNRFKQVDRFIARGANLRAFCNCLPIVYAAGTDKMWNYLIDLGAKSELGEDLEKR